jgi:hypothetical protein
VEAWAAASVFVELRIGVGDGDDVVVVLEADDSVAVALNGEDKPGVVLAGKSEAGVTAVVIPGGVEPERVVDFIFPAGGVTAGSREGIGCGKRNTTERRGSRGAMEGSSVYLAETRARARGESEISTGVWSVKSGDR